MRNYCSLPSSSFHPIYLPLFGPGHFTTSQGPLPHSGPQFGSVLVEGDRTLSLNSSQPEGRQASAEMQGPPTFDITDDDAMSSGGWPGV